MKHVVKDSPSEDQLKETKGSFYKPNLVIKSPSTQNLNSKPTEAAAARADVKRKTTTGDGAESAATVTKSEMKKMTIRPFPKGLFKKKPEPQKVESTQTPKVPPAVTPGPPKEDSFLKNLDVSKLDFSKYSERSSKKVDLSDQDNRILDEVDKPKPLGKFKRRDNLEISPVMSEDEDAKNKDKSMRSMKTSTLLKELSRNEKKEYIVPFNWGESGEVEIRSMR